MKHLIILLCCLGSALFLQAQHTTMPAQTIAAISTIQKGLNHESGLLSTKVTDLYPIYTNQGRNYIAVLCKINSSFQPAQAAKDGFDIGAILGGIASMRIPLHFLDENFSYPGIDYLEVAGKIAPELDGALLDSRVNLVHKGTDLPQSYAGRNVLLGVVDWGFDYTHPTFFDTTLSYSRILASWDQVKTIGTPPEGFSHGALYMGADELAAAQHDTVSPLTDYHGTHVAGIAGGSGGGTIYRGVGFDSDLLFSQMRNDVSSSIDAFQWMYNVSQATGKRLVINNSWGNYRMFPLDGTSLMSQAIDAFTDLGVVFVFSAGNNGDINFHLKKEFNNDSIRTRIMGFDYGNDEDLWGQSIAMWGEPDQSFSVQLRVLNAQNQLLVQTELFNTATIESYIDSFIVTGTDTIFYHLTTDAAHPLNGRPQMTLDVQNKNAALRKVLYAEAPTGTVHFWNTRFTVYGIGNWGYGFTAPAAGYVAGDRNYGIGHPALSNTAITTAAHQTNFHLANFSSYGPRMDDVQKPDISAPGLSIASAFNSFSSSGFAAVAETTFNGRDYEFVRLSGTSMSAPMVSGVVALLLEADPSLSAAAIKDILLQTARTDALTGEIGPEGHLRWGHGKLDAYAAIQSLSNTSTVEYPKATSRVFPNPAHDVVFVTKEWSGKAFYTLTTLDGKGLKDGLFEGAVALDEIPNGLYILSIRGPHGIETFKIAVAKP